MKFQAGKTYKTRSIVDSDYWITVAVKSRTAKTINTTTGKSYRVFLDYTGAEAVRPWGNYSMAPIISAHDQ